MNEDINISFLIKILEYYIIYHVYQRITNIKRE